MIQDLPYSQEISKIVTFVKSKILNFLSIKPRTEYEIKSKIKQILQQQKESDINNEEKKEIELIVVRDLIQSNLINDLQYSKDFVREKLNSNSPQSRYKITKFLLIKKIPQKYIDIAMKDFTAEAEETILNKEIAKKLKNIRDKNPFIVKMKLKKFLVSKGYSYELINAVVDSYLGVK